MPIYEYACPSCNVRFEVVKRMKNSGIPENCPECGTQGEKQVSLTSFVLKGDDWPGKAQRVKGQMKARRETLAQKEKDHAAPPMQLKPNVGGEETGTWSEAQKLAASKGKNTDSYEPLVQKEKRGDT